MPNKRNKHREQWVPRKSDAASVPFSSELSNSLPHSLSHCEKGCVSCEMDGTREIRACIGS